jgi:ribosomal protein S27AE
MNIIDERYVNGKIYKIVCNETNEVYYGSTILSLKDRIIKHKCSLKCESRQIINRNNYYYELIEDYSCNNRKELETRERWYIENNKCINKIIPTRTLKEYYQENKEKILEKKNEKIPCPRCGSITTKNHLKRHQRGQICLSKIDSKNSI